VNTSSNAYTLAMPWYEREDFDRLRALADDRHQMIADYDRWHLQAMAVAQKFLARRKALQIITIRPNEFLEWLSSQDLPNTSASRLRYVEMRAMAGTAAIAKPESENVIWPAP